MKRSEINSHIDETLNFFEEMNFHLPGWSRWDIEEWRKHSDAICEIQELGLGWDITDFGSGRFESTGLINFNLRNGRIETSKCYCEKILLVGEDQYTPMHTHKTKIEDIINRGGGVLLIEFINSDEGLTPDDRPVEIWKDQMKLGLKRGDTLRLLPGESISLYPGTYHTFYGEQGKGRVLVGEVSTVNDDSSDNVFMGDNFRFPAIEENCTPMYLLVNDYDKYIK